MNESFHFKKSLGQNFLHDENIVRKIIAQARITFDDCVIEIGPGAGALTKYLVEVAGKVVAVEIDERLYDHLETTFASERFELLRGDILKIPKEILETAYKGYKRVIVVANLPYYITTPIMKRLFLEHPAIEQMTLMVQKEVGERLLAQPRTKAYGSLTLFTAYFGTITDSFVVKRTAFKPAPRVDSLVFTLTREIHPRPISLSVFEDVIQSAFQMRRKTLVNNISKGLGLSKEDIQRSIQELGFEERIRPEELSFEMYMQLAFVLESAYTTRKFAHER